MSETPAEPASSTGPAVSNTDWILTSPADVGLAPNAFAELAPQFEAWPESNIHSALIVYRGKLIYEHYFTGEDQRWGQPRGRVAFDSSVAHDMRSISKSVTSLAFGIARDRGLIPDLETPIFDLLPDYADLRTPETEKITLQHLLTMSAGLKWNEEIPYADPANSERQMSDASDRLRYVLQQPLVRPPGATYNYSGGLTTLLGAVITRLTGQPFDAFVQEALFDPLGITKAEWVRYQSDRTAMVASGLRLRPRDLARIGQMVLSKGVWSGTQVVSRHWIEQALTPQINGPSLFFYGYQWWLGRSLVAKREIRWAAAMGYGGQRMYIVPDRDLVVVVTAGLYGGPILQDLPGEVVLRRYALATVLGD